MIYIIPVFESRDWLCDLTVILSCLCRYYSNIPFCISKQMSARGRPVSSDFSRPGGRSPIQVRRSAARPPSSGQVSSRQQAHHAGSRAGGSHMKAALSPSGGAPPPLPPR